MINLFMLAKAYELDINFCVGLLTYQKIQHTCGIASILSFLIKSKESEFIANQVITQQKRGMFYFHGVAQWVSIMKALVLKNLIDYAMLLKIQII